MEDIDLKKLLATILAVGSLYVAQFCSMGCVLVVIDEPEFYID